MATHAEKTAQTRERLLEAAVELFAENGYRGTSVAAIGERAGMSRGVVNFHFGTKEALFGEILSEVVAGWEQDVEKPPVDSPQELNAVVDELLRSHRMALEEHPQKVAIIYSLMFEAMGPAPDMRKEVAKLMSRQRSDMVNFVKYAQSVGTMPADIDPEGHATWFIAALRGIVYQYLMDPEAIDLTATYRELKKHLVARLELANLLEASGAAVAD